MRGVVVCPQPLAAEIGAAVRADGGNAFDAAIATAFDDHRGMTGASDPRRDGGIAAVAAGGR